MLETKNPKFFAAWASVVNIEQNEKKKQFVSKTSKK